jgi:TPR repeat protein
MKETSETPDQRDGTYWLGWFAGAVRKALTKLEAVDEKNKPIEDPQDVADNLRVTWDDFMEGDVAQNEAFQEMHGKTWAGFVVEADTGEAQALRGTYAAAVAAVDQAESYWEEAVASGHPGAASFVAAMYPFRIRQVTHDEWQDILEDGTPVLDRGP